MNSPFLHNKLEDDTHGLPKLPQQQMQACTLCAKIEITWPWVWATWNSSEEKVPEPQQPHALRANAKIARPWVWVTWNSPEEKKQQKFETLGQDPDHWTNHTKTRLVAPSPIYFGENPKSVALPNMNYPLLRNALDYDTHELPEPPQQQYNRALCMPRLKITWPWV